jgi:hypothetical protein
MGWLGEPPLPMNTRPDSLSAVAAVYDRRKPGPRPSAIGGHRPPLQPEAYFATCTLAPSASESDGLTMMLSSGVIPLVTSRLVP